MLSILRKNFYLLTVLVAVAVLAVNASYAEDMTRAEFNRIVKLAKKGDPKSQNTLGDIYCGNIYYEGLKKDYKRGFYWYQKAAEQNFALAYDNIGYMYYYGYGVEKDYKEAMTWYQKAAEQNIASSQNAIGVLYLNGYGVNKDYMEALSWFIKAADQNNNSAMYNIGVCYEHGWGVPQNYDEAMKWYKWAAEHGNKKAMEIYNAYMSEQVAAMFLQRILNLGGNTQYDSTGNNEGQQWRKCDVCDGTGQCPDCHGTGKSDKVVKMYGLFDSYYDYLECNTCRGRVGRCYQCDGTGQIAASLW